MDSIQSLFGAQVSSFHFEFTGDGDCVLKVDGFPSEAVDGWRIKSCNPPVVSHIVCMYTLHVYISFID